MSDRLQRHSPDISGGGRAQSLSRSGDVAGETTTKLNCSYTIDW